MKNSHQERLRRLMKQYHRYRQWRLNSGLFIPHAYPDPQELSWWDDVGFILNGRRVMVWWVHPRMEYANAIGHRSWREAGDPPDGGANLLDLGEKQWKKVGRSRKKVVAYRSRPTSDSLRDYYAKLRAIETRIKSEGIDLVICPSMSTKACSWCTGISLCIPVEVRNEKEVAALAMLAKRLIKGETRLANEFPGYQYTRDDWLAEVDRRKQVKQQ